MKDVHPILGVCLFVVLILIDNVLYGMKAALENVNESEFEEYDEKKKNRILKLTSKRSEFAKTLHVIAVIIDLVTGAFLLEIFAGAMVKYNIISSNFVAYVVVTCVLFVLLEVFGILVPERLALVKPWEYISKYYDIATALMVIFFPITKVITFVSGLIERMCGVDPHAELDKVSEEDIMDMVNEGHEQGVLLESEAKMINNIIEFDNKIVKDVMIHRKNIIAIEGSTTLEKAVQIFIEEGLSRIPIYEEDLDSVVGILHFKDAFKEYGDVAKRKLTILAFKDILYDAHFIPETRSINVLFKEMQLRKNHMSIVVDEYGQTDGLVTMEDIIEEIVGNILDEHDQDDNNIKKQSENVYVVDGLTALDELEELLDIEFDEKEFETLNGLLISKFGKIPSEHERFEIAYKGYIFKVLRVQNKIVSKVRIVKNDK